MPNFLLTIRYYFLFSQKIDTNFLVLISLNTVWQRECGGLYHMGPRVRPTCGQENIEEKGLRTKKRLIFYINYFINYFKFFFLTFFIMIKSQQNQLPKNIITKITKSKY